MFKPKCDNPKCACVKYPLQFAHCPVCGKLCLWEELKYLRDEPCATCKKMLMDDEEFERF